LLPLSTTAKASLIDRNGIFFSVAGFVGNLMELCFLLLFMLHHYYQRPFLLLLLCSSSNSCSTTLGDVDDANLFAATNGCKALQHQIHQQHFFNYHCLVSLLLHKSLSYVSTFCKVLLQGCNEDNGKAGNINTVLS
jgi:hypothetical protein